jgi:hypothetical protein
VTALSGYDDDIQFDFFDEPETVEATQRTRRPSRRSRGGGDGSDGSGPRRPHMRTPTGLVPLARLVGLIAIAIVVVLVLVLWVSSCQGNSKHDAYASYASKMSTIAQSSAQVGQEFANMLVSPGLKEADLETALQQYAQQEQQAFTQAQQIRPPGPLRAIHQQSIDALELRAKGLAGLSDALSRSGTTKDDSATTQALTVQAGQLTASDVVWDQLYRLPATQRLKEEDVTGVVIPDSNFVANADLVSSRSFGLLMTRLNGASTGGTPSGKHGDGLVGTRVEPQGIDLSTSTAKTVKVSADLAFVATVENSGDFQNVGVPVTLRIDAGGNPIVRRETISVIQPAEQKTVRFTSFNLPTTAFGAKAQVRVEVGAVAGEINTDNNTATYTVFFTLS